MFFAIAVALTAVMLAYLFFVRDKDIPEAPPVLPYHHLETRKAAIYENLRDLQFEFRVGKLSDEDYQRTKKGLQSELASVMAEIDQMKGGSPAPPPATEAPSSAGSAGSVCPHCGSKFERSLKFCGECGKSMAVNA